MIGYEIISFLLTRGRLVDYLREHPLESGVTVAVILQRIFAGRMEAVLSAFGFTGDQAALFILSISQVLFVLNVFLRSVRRAQFSRFLKLNPSLIFLLSFALVILSGTLLLWMPRSTHGTVNPVDLFFVAVSATCVTGLSPIDISVTLSRTGQVILLVLIQVGGLGLMTLTSFFSYFLTGRTSFQASLMMRDLLSEQSMGHVRGILKSIALATFSIEVVGAIFLFFTTPAGTIDSVPERAFHALFHSVSAFCNAGFSLYTDGMAHLNRGGHLYQSGIMLLIVLGGAGFPVLRQLYFKVYRFNDVKTRLSVTTRLVIYTNLMLYAVGFVLYFFLERNSTLSGVSFFDRIFHSLFFTITNRTAGFNTFDIAAMGIPVTLISLFLMWVGASPISTGGGIKTTTLAIVFLHVTSYLRGKNGVEVFRKRISGETVDRAYISVLMSVVVVLVAVFLITLLESAPILNILYEVVSAFGTVGLSRGFTTVMSDPVKIILSVIMLMGRVGILTFLVAFMPRRRTPPYSYPSEYVVVG